MPNTASAKKRLRQSEKRRASNRARRSELRSLLRSARAAVAAGDVAKSEETFLRLAKRWDQAAAAGIVHRNAAARIKSRMSGHIRALKQGSAA